MSGFRREQRTVNDASVATKNHRGRVFYQAAFATLAVAVAIVGVELLMRQLFVSGFSVLALLVAAVGFSLAGRVQHRHHADSDCV